MKITINYIIQFVLAMLLICMTAIIIDDNDEMILSGEFSTYNTGWTCIAGDEKEEYDTLPKHMDTDYTGSIYMQKKLGEVNDGEALAFYVVHQFVTVRVDGEIIYEIKENKKSHSQTNGNGWLFADLRSEYSNKLIEIEVYSNYENLNGKLLSFYIGEKTAIFNALISQEIIPILICIFMLFVGFMLAIFYVLAGKKLNISKSLFWLGIFSIDLAIWSGMETEFFTLFFGKYLLCSQITFISLYILLIPVVKFIQETKAIVNTKILEVLAIIWGSCVAIAILLQIFGILDLRYWAIYCDLIYAITAIVGITLVIITFKNAAREIIIKNAGHIICIVVLSFCVVLDVYNYLFTDILDSAKYGRIGFLVYILGLAVSLLKDTVNDYCDKEKYENLEEEAFHDALTKTGNRTAFQKDCVNIYSKNPREYATVMFDLNNLKYYNDNFGHGNGDWYIITCSEIIQDIFGYDEDERVYRIGGDEFCAVIKNITYEQYLEKVNAMNEMANSLNDDFFSGNMGIASGYAHFDSTLDTKIQDTLKRADVKMYEKKLQMKNLDTTGSGKEVLLNEQNTNC